MFKVVLIIALLAFTPSEALLKESQIKKVVDDLVSLPTLSGLPTLGNLLPIFAAVIGGTPESEGGEESEAGAEINLPTVKPVLVPLPGETPVIRKVKIITPVKHIIKSYSTPQYYSYVPVTRYAVRNKYALPYAYYP